MPGLLIFEKKMPRHLNYYFISFWFTVGSKSRKLQFPRFRSYRRNLAFDKKMRPVLINPVIKQSVAVQGVSRQGEGVEVGGRSDRLLADTPDLCTLSTP